MTTPRKESSTWPERITGTFRAGTIAEVAQLLEYGESLTSFARSAVAHEIGIRRSVKDLGRFLNQDDPVPK